MTVGGVGRTLETGWVLDDGSCGDDHRRLSSLHLSLMDQQGDHLAPFGDADARLAGTRCPKIAFALDFGDTRDYLFKTPSQFGFTTLS